MSDNLPRSGEKKKRWLDIVCNSDSAQNSPRPERVAVVFVDSLHPSLDLFGFPLCPFSFHLVKYVSILVFLPIWRAYRELARFFFYRVFALCRIISRRQHVC